MNALTCHSFSFKYSNGLLFSISFWLVLYAIASLASMLIFVGSCRAEPAPTASKLGKYPASLLVKTRTATIYPESLRVFTWVTTHSDFKKRRDLDGDMDDLPSGMHHRRTTSVLWGEYGVNGRFQIGIGIPYVFKIGVKYHIAPT